MNKESISTVESEYLEEVKKLRDNWKNNVQLIKEINKVFGDLSQELEKLTKGK